MIIRTSQRRDYSALPNSMLRDKRLSLDTRGMLAYLNSLPRNWQVRPAILAKHLSPIGGRPIGTERLRRMFAEAQAAGYMARSEKQGHGDDGTWGSFLYIIGADPSVVAAEIASLSESVAFLPQAALPHTAEPHTAKPHTYKRKKDNNNPKLKTETPEFQFGTVAIVEGLDKAVEQDCGRDLEAKPGQQGNQGQVRRQRRPETIQQEIAYRLGRGDVAAGWIILGELSDSQRDELTAQQRIGNLDDAALERARRGVREGGQLSGEAGGGQPRGGHARKTFCERKTFDCTDEIQTNQTGSR